MCWRRLRRVSVSSRLENGASTTYDPGRRSVASNTSPPVRASRMGLVANPALASTRIGTVIAHQYVSSQRVRAAAGGGEAGREGARVTGAYRCGMKFAAGALREKLV